MARKKTETKPPPAPPQKSVINLKGTERQREWLAAVVKKTHISAATITRLAYDEWGRNHGHGGFPDMEAGK